MRDAGTREDVFHLGKRFLWRILEATDMQRACLRVGERTPEMRCIHALGDAGDDALPAEACRHLLLAPDAIEHAHDLGLLSKQGRHEAEGPFEPIALRRQDHEVLGTRLLGQPVPERIHLPVHGAHIPRVAGKARGIHREGDGILSESICCHASIEHPKSSLSDDCDVRLSHPKSFLQKMFRIKGIVAHPLSAAGSQPGNKRKRTDTCPA